MTTTSEDWARLGAEVKRRREQLYLRQRDVELRGGPGPGTMRNLEQATRDGYALRTFDSLERALEWAPGTITRILQGSATAQEVSQRATPDDGDPDLRWDLLADAIRRRRGELRLSQELGSRGGPGSMTVAKLERGEPTSVRNKTKSQLERALRWPPGHVDQLLAGEVLPGAHSAPPEAPQAVEPHRPMFPTVQSAIDDDARALRIGRLVLALLDELTTETR